MLDGLQRADPSDAFRPMFVGVTWPSLWNTLGYASFRNKGHDADEVGHIYIAWLLHRLAPELKRELDLKVVAIGRSFGARMVTRGLFSRPLVRDAAPTGERMKGLIWLWRFRAHSTSPSSCRSETSRPPMRGTPSAPRLW
jgi:hypothetical protein